MRNWLRTLLFVSAFSPALLTMAYVRCDIYGLNTEVYQLIIIGLIGFFIPLIIVRMVETQGENFNIQVKKIESSDFVLLAFVGSYLLPLVLKSAEMSVNSIMLVLGFIGIILWLISSLPAHPLLRIFRFRFYKIESSSGVVYTLISKREIRDPKEISSVKKLSETMLMETENYV